jgi:hypothetical protein
MTAARVSAGRGRAGRGAVAARALREHEVFLEEVQWFRSFGMSHVRICDRMGLTRDVYAKRMKAIAEKYELPGAEELLEHYRAEMEVIAQEARARGLAEQGWNRRRVVR